MTYRTVVVIVLAVVFGVAAAVYATNAVHKNRQAHDAEKVNVVVTLKAIPRGTHLTEELLEVKQVTKDSLLSPDAVQTIEEITKEGGRITSVDLVKGDMVLESKLAREGAREGMAPLIRKNEKDETLWMQAATILTPTASAGVGGFIRPGDRVDVLLTVDHFSEKDKGGTIRLMQRVEVLATDNRLESMPNSVEGKVVDQRELRYVTLLVTPKQAQELALAQKQGTLTLSLRNPEDTSTLPTVVVTESDLHLPRQEPNQPKMDTPPPPIRFVRGGAESTTGNTP